MCHLPYMHFNAADAPYEDQRLAISYTREDDIFVVTLTGGLVGKTSGDLFDALTQLVTGGGRKLILDVSRVRVANRAGLRGIVVAAKMLQGQRGQMRIIGARGGVMEALDNLSMTHLIHLDQSRVEAEAALAHLSVGPAGASRPQDTTGHESKAASQQFGPDAISEFLVMWERDDVA